LTGSTGSTGELIQILILFILSKLFSVHEKTRNACGDVSGSAARMDQPDDR
jgi:hypothetical protein